VVATTKSSAPTLERDQAVKRPATTIRWVVAVGLFTAASVGTGLILWAMASVRGVNADEGFYLLAGWRVLGGQRPYADFFFPQMPYLPYLTAWTVDLVGPSLPAVRVTSVLCAALLAGILAVAAAWQTGRVGIGALVAILYAGNALVLQYLTIAKPYAVTNLFLVIAFLLVVVPASGLVGVAVAGACAAIAVGVRLPSVAVLAVLSLWTMRRGWRPAAAFAAGAISASLPWIWLAVQDPSAFWFGNVGFHALRGEISGTGALLGQKAVVLAKWLLMPQNALLWAMAIAGAIMKPREGVLAMLCAGVLAVGYLAATPTYLEYMVQVLPFLLLSAIPALVVLSNKRALAVAVLALYAGGFVAARRTPPDASLRGAKRELWNLETVERVSTYLRDRSEPGDRILSWWEGYPLLAGRDGFLGVGFWESNVAKKLPPEARERLHVLHRDDIRALIEAREPRLIVFPEGTWQTLRAVMAHHYEHRARFGSIEVLELRGEPSDEPPRATEGHRTS
jgi:hypothetical protein